MFLNYFWNYCQDGMYFVFIVYNYYHATTRILCFICKAHQENDVNDV